MPSKKSDEPENDDDVEPEQEAPPTPDAKKIAKDVADPERGKYDAEMIGDSTLVIRYEDGTTDSFTVSDVTRNG